MLRPIRKNLSVFRISGRKMSSNVTDAHQSNEKTSATFSTLNLPSNAPDPCIRSPLLGPLLASSWHANFQWFMQMSTKQTSFSSPGDFCPFRSGVKMCKWILTRRRTGRGGGRTPGVSAGSDGQTGASLCPIAEANLRDAVQLLRYLFIQFKANEICARVHRITISFNAIYRTKFRPLGAPQSNFKWPSTLLQFRYNSGSWSQISAWRNFKIFLQNFTTQIRHWNIESQGRKRAAR